LTRLCLPRNESDGGATPPLCSSMYSNTSPRVRIFPERAARAAASSRAPSSRSIRRARISCSQTFRMARNACGDSRALQGGVAQRKDITREIDRTQQSRPTALHTAGGFSPLSMPLRVSSNAKGTVWADLVVEPLQIAPDHR